MNEMKPIQVEQNATNQINITSTTWTQWGKAAFAFTVATGAYALTKAAGLLGGSATQPQTQPPLNQQRSNITSPVAAPAMQYPNLASEATQSWSHSIDADVYTPSFITLSALAISAPRYPLITLGLSFMQHLPRVEAVFPATLDLANITDSEGFILQGAAGNDWTGYSVSTAGDVNGDGLADVLVGARLADSLGRSAAGAAYLLFGTNGSWPAVLDLGNLTASQGVVLQGAAALDEMGRSVSAAGDVNGDGLADVLVGAYQADPLGRPEAGVAYLLFGANGSWPAILDLANLTATEGVVLQGAVTGDFTGISVSAAGDVNGDGLSDVLVGAYLADPLGRTNAGSAYLLFGLNGSWPATIDLGSLTPSQGVLLQGAAGDATGRSVSAAGDVNGDGLADVLVGANGADPLGRSSAGVAYLLFGMNGSWPAVLDLGNLNSNLGVVLQGAAASDATGLSVSAAGDVNGDGLADVMVGANGADPLGRSSAGVAYLVFGRTGSWPGVLDLGNLTGSLGVVLQGAAMGEGTGVSVSAAGDVNADGLADVLVGADSADPLGRSNAGVAYLLFGVNGSWPALVDLGNLTSAQGVVLQGSAAGDDTGISVSAAGDINGDGLADVLVGAYRADPLGRSAAGVAYVVLGQGISLPNSTFPLTTSTNPSPPSLISTPSPSTALALSTTTVASITSVSLSSLTNPSTASQDAASQTLLLSSSSSTMAQSSTGTNLVTTPSLIDSMAQPSTGSTSISRSSVPRVTTTSFSNSGVSIEESRGSNSDGNGSNATIIIASIVSVAVLTGIVIAAVCIGKKRKQYQEDSSSESESPIPTKPTKPTKPRKPTKPDSDEIEFLDMEATPTANENYTIPVYQLEYGKELGGGAFGTVYKGTWLHNEVAIKQLKDQSLSGTAYDEFQHEVGIMAQLRNPRVVHFYGACFEKNNYAIVMEYLSKGSLYQYLHSDKDIAWPQRVQLGKDVGTGLTYLHNQHILHRDLKSLNVLLSREKKILRAKLTDFGLSKIKTQSQMTVTEGGKGTLPWMAPELVTIKPRYSQASDVYSYGMVIWELSTRAIPFEDTHPTVIPNLVSKGERPDIPKGTPKGIVKLIKQCWAQEPEERPSAHAIVSELDTIEVPSEHYTENKQKRDKKTDSTTSSSSYSTFGGSANFFQSDKMGSNTYQGNLVTGQGMGETQSALNQTGRMQDNLQTFA